MNRTWANVRNFRNSNLARTRLVKKKKKKIDPLTKRSHILEDIPRDASFVPRDSLTSRETNLAFATLPLALFPAASSLAPHRRNQIETTNRARTGRWSPFESPPGKLFTSRAVDYRFVVLSARSPPLPSFFSFFLPLSLTDISSSSSSSSKNRSRIRSVVEKIVYVMLRIVSVTISQ